jgi:hypothetical protein
MEPLDCPLLTLSRLQEYDLQDPSCSLELLKPVLIERILESGTREEVRWLFSRFEEEAISAHLEKHGFRHLSPQSQIFWARFFNLPSPLLCQKSP